MQFCRLSNFGQKSSLVSGFALGRWSSTTYAVDNIFLTWRLSPPPPLVQDKLEIGNEMVQYICFVMYPSEILQSCGKSNFGHVIYYMAPTKRGYIFLTIDHNKREHRKPNEEVIHDILRIINNVTQRFEFIYFWFYGYGIVKAFLSSAWQQGRVDSIFLNIVTSPLPREKKKS